MAHAEALRGGTLKTGERPPPTLRGMHFHPSPTSPPFPSHNTPKQSTSNTAMNLSEAEEEVTLALQGLDKAESLKNNRNDLVGAKRLYELSIGVLIRFLNNKNGNGSNSSSSPKP
eukprot:13974832-Ditylum_brightwellii.AAC.1